MDKSMNLTLTFDKINSTLSRYYYGADTKMSYVLNNITLEYESNNPYFQNHEGKLNCSFFLPIVCFQAIT